MKKKAQQKKDTQLQTVNQKTANHQLANQAQPQKATNNSIGFQYLITDNLSDYKSGKDRDVFPAFLMVDFVAFYYHQN